ncbi:MAG: hypothetical protein PHN46_02980, partial [Eubacteriales bacterium]|nr:hypothetical protein [Eubacteriales bacterium]
MANGEVIKMGKATLTFFNDDRPVTNIPMNYRSMMLNITFGNRSILLTADVTGESLALLGEKYPELMDADILKSPHHGLNRLRTETYGHITPEAVIITNTRSGGENLANQFICRKIPHYFIKAHDKIDILLAHNDDMALGAIESIKAAGLVPGKDIIIVGCDA